MSVEAETWLAAQPKTAEGKVDVRVMIAEGQRRGYCICPKPMREMIDFSGLTCTWCGQPETRQSWAFWHQQGEWKPVPVQDCPHKPACMNIVACYEERERVRINGA